jgi:hypothetical protein
LISLDGITLPAGLLWSDEFAAAPVAQTVRRTLDGSMVVFFGAQRQGLPITLASQLDQGWLTRSQVEAVRLRADSPGGVYLLALRGQTRPVMFRHHEGPAFEATPLVLLANPGAGDFYLATLKLMTV